MNEETLFDLLRNTPEAQRPALLDQHCANDSVLRARIQALLQADEQTLGYLTRQNDPHGTKSHHEPIGATGQIVAGKYKLIDNIGEGGMGSVWRAQQSEPVKRLVAVKLIKAGMDSKAVLARFEAERQALAVMDHPNIAKILDGGLHENRPYFVMELVKGVPITTYCDARKLNPKERLELFLPVCGAIQHAHMKGIIHRDIKPSNVIVALYDDKPIPKVIDFGIAKATGGGLTDASYMTAFGGVVGTPQYMSPEQASLNNLDIDTRSDVYSLGVLLYELLAGSPPFKRDELEKAGLLEILRVVREEEPIRPSAKLSTAAALPTLSANRATEPKQLTGLLRNELDWIVMKSLEKDRTRRYESANSFAADVSRYLAGEAVQAVPPSVGYRMKKWVRKNRGLVLASGLVVGTLSVGVVGTTFGLLRAEAEANRANQEATNANAARATAERNLVQSYMRPVGYNINEIDPAEYVALAELSGNESESIKLLFLEEALADGERALRVARRADRVVQAAVGPSLKRRTAALELCQRKQKDKSADPRIRLCACWLAAELGEVDVASIAMHSETLLKEKNLTDYDKFLAHLPYRINSEQSNELASAYISMLRTSTNDNFYSAAAYGLAAVAPMLDAATNKDGFDALLKFQRTPKNYDAFTSAMDGLRALAPKLDAARSKTIADALIIILRTSNDSNAISVAACALEALSAQLDAATSKSSVDALIAIVCNSTINKVPYEVNALFTLAPKLDAASSKTTADVLTAILRTSNDSDALRVGGDGLAALAPKLDAATIKAGADALITILRTSKDYRKLGAAGKRFAALAPKLDAATIKAGADALVAILRTSKDFTNWREARDGLEALAPQLDAVTSKTTADALIAILRTSKADEALNAAGYCLAALAPQLDTATSKISADALIAILRTANEQSVLHSAERGLAALAPKLDAASSTTTADALLTILRTSANDNARRAAIECLEALAPKLDAAKIKASADALIAVLRTSKECSLDYTAGRGLAALAAKLDDTFSKTTADALLIILRTATDEYVFGASVAGLVALAPKLDAATIKASADALLTILRTSKNSTFQYYAATGLTALAPKLDTEFANELFTELLALFVQSTESKPQVLLWDTLIALADRLRPEDQTRQCEAALKAVLRCELRAVIYASEEWGKFNISDDDFHQLLIHIDSVGFLAELLREPACVGQYREAILSRLDELAYPDAAYNAATSTNTTAFSAVLGTTAAPLMQDNRHRTRKLRTLHDATKWLAEHHPEIDLDKPYAKTSK